MSIQIIFRWAILIAVNIQSNSRSTTSSTAKSEYKSWAINKHNSQTLKFVNSLDLMCFIWCLLEFSPVLLWPNGRWDRYTENHQQDGLCRPYRRIWTLFRQSPLERNSQPSASSLYSPTPNRTLRNRNGRRSFGRIWSSAGGESLRRSSFSMPRSIARLKRSKVLKIY